MNGTALQLDWQLQALAARLQALQGDITLQVLPAVGSTNTELLERSRQGRAPAAPVLLAAEVQSAGRGRNGRTWQAAAGASLTFSLAWPLPAQPRPGLSLAVGVALADALEPPGRRLALKWPNDLWLRDGGEDREAGGRKCGGVLIETVAAAQGRLAVVGVGLNLAPLGGPAEAFSSGQASLAELQPGIDAPLALAQVAPALVAALQRFDAEGLAPFAERFAARDLLRGRWVHTTQGGLEAGVAEGIDTDGALQLRSGGRLHAVHSGEVSVRLQPLASGHDRQAAGADPC